LPLIGDISLFKLIKNIFRVKYLIQSLNKSNIPDGAWQPPGSSGWGDQASGSFPSKAQCFPSISPFCQPHDVCLETRGGRESLECMLPSPYLQPEFSLVSW
jgi:hypothetical protein